MAYRGKRLFDLVVSLGLLLLLLPAMIVIAVIVALRMGRPVLFRQERPGQHEQPFFIFKFRTMRNLADKYGRPLCDRDRLTRTGRLLRELSLDELPNLLNVIRGDMSLVGPRPLLFEYGPYYSARERKRFSALPGITGWAQVHGRNQLAWDERLEHDVWYVENCSFGLDVKILLLTVAEVLRRSNVCADSADMGRLNVVRGSHDPSTT